MLFFFNDTATTEIYTLSLHDALPIWTPKGSRSRPERSCCSISDFLTRPWWLILTRISFPPRTDRKSTRLNSSHLGISYAVFCLKKKKKENITDILRYINSITYQALLS